MLPLEFSCPHCQTTLRLQDEAFLQTTFPCPDCGRGLVIERAEPTGKQANAQRVVVRAADAISPSRNAVSAASVAARSSRRRRAARTGLRHAANPVVIAWSTALAVAAAFALIIWSDGSDTPSSQPKQPSSQSGQSESVPDGRDITQDDDVPRVGNREIEHQAGGPSVPARSNPSEFWVDAGQLLQRLLERSDSAVPERGPRAAQRRVAQSDREAEAAENSESAERSEPADPNATLPEAMRPRPSVTAQQLTARLQQPVTWFELSEPTPLREQLEFFETLLETPLNFSDAVETRLEQPVTISERDTTVEGVLRSLLAQLELELEIDEHRIWIRDARTTDRRDSQQTQQRR